MVRTPAKTLLTIRVDGGRSDGPANAIPHERYSEQSQLTTPRSAGASSLMLRASSRIPPATGPQCGRSDRQRAAFSKRSQACRRLPNHRDSNRSTLFRRSQAPSGERQQRHEPVLEPFKWRTEDEKTHERQTSGSEVTTASSNPVDQLDYSALTQPEAQIGASELVPNRRFPLGRVAAASAEFALALTGSSVAFVVRCSP